MIVMSFSSQRYRDASKWFLMLVIVIVTIAASINRQLVGLIAQSVKLEFGFSDAQLGSLVSIAGVMPMLLYPLLGHMADTLDRHKLMIGSIVFYSLATAVYASATTYVVLALGFGILAFSESALNPVFQSLIAGRYKGPDRVNANLVNFAAGGLTTGLGSYLAGLMLLWAGHHLIQITPRWHGATEWRIALGMAALVGVPLALTPLLLGKDTRTKKENLVSHFNEVKKYWSQHWKVMMSMNVALSFYIIGAGAILGWIPIYVIRHFGITPAELGMRIGLVIGIADIAGVVVGFLAIKKLYARLGPLAPRYIFQVALCTIVLLNIGQFFATSAWGVLLLCATQNFVATFGTASSNNMTQDLSPPNLRGKLIGINGLMVALMTMPGPILVGILSDRITGTPQGLLWAIVLVSSPCFLISVLLYTLTNRAFVNTVNAVALAEATER